MRLSEIVETLKHIIRVCLMTFGIVFLWSAALVIFNVSPYFPIWVRVVLILLSAAVAGLLEMWEAY